MLRAHLRVDGFSARLAAAIDRARLSCSEVQRLIAYGGHGDRVRGWTLGDGEPSILYLARLADVLGCSADWLLGLTDDPTIHRGREQTTRGAA